jgi:nucleoside-diphosphate-sugar epimerase
MSAAPHHTPRNHSHSESGARQHIVIGSDGAAFETARAAQERGYEAIVLVPRGALSARSIPADLCARDLDHRSPEALRRHFEAAACIHYCAGTTGYPIDSEEPERLARIIEAASAARARFVYCDAPYAYGVSNRPLSEDLPHRARDPLGSFLAALSQFVLQSHRKGHIEAFVARHGDLIGPQIIRSPFGEAFVERVLRATPVTVLGRKDAGRSLTYSRDLGRALILLSEQSEAAGQIWHLPSSAPIAPEKLVATLRAVAGLPPMAPNLIHETAVRGIAGMLGAKAAERSLSRLHETPFTLVSAKFERAFGMHATSLKDLVRETLLSLTHA